MQFEIGAQHNDFDIEDAEAAVRTMLLLHGFDSVGDGRRQILFEAFATGNVYQRNEHHIPKSQRSF
ncbi:hypothetical protein DCC62_29930 [candidate division KSB1 bacterium]|nr:MAG: hypothetical protein DCC62_29930 [candidate division KSB1 bacterium]